LYKNKDNIEIIELVRLGVAESVENMGFSSLVISCRTGGLISIK